VLQPGSSLDRTNYVYLHLLRFLDKSCFTGWGVSLPRNHRPVDQASVFTSPGDRMGQLHPTTPTLGIHSGLRCPVPVPVPVLATKPEMQ